MTATVKKGFCSICKADFVWGDGHRCSASVLRAIDSANTRALDREDRDEPSFSFEPGFGQRLSDGFDATGPEFDDEPT